MSALDLLLSIIALVVLVGVPAGMIWGVVYELRHGRKRPRKGSGGTPIGSALVELDRLVARPSVEHIVEAENQALRREDDQGGE
jgi:hypothetical protein